MDFNSFMGPFFLPQMVSKNRNQNVAMCLKKLHTPSNQNKQAKHLNALLTRLFMLLVAG